MSSLARAAAQAVGFDAVGAELVECVAEPIAGSSGAATAEVARVTGRVRAGTAERPFSLIRKSFRPLTEGRHAAAANDPGHWAYWRRELLAYQSGLVPNGPHLAAPRCFGVDEDAIYLADVAGPAESVDAAARRLGGWQAATPVPDVGWLSGHQLAQRIAVSSLDWSTVDAPEPARDIWKRRTALLAALQPVPLVVCHGDFHTRNLIGGPEVTTVLDWGSFGAGPLGADLAHLALSTGCDPLPAYLDGLGAGFDQDLVAVGFYLTMALTASGRIHWMLSRGMPVPASYVELATTAVNRLPAAWAGR